MSHSHPLPIKEGIEKILRSYQDCFPVDGKTRFQIAGSARSSELDALAVFVALLENAIDPISVAVGLWTIFKPYLGGFERRQVNEQSVLFPPEGGWIAVDSILLSMGEVDEEALTERIIKHAREWVTYLLLPIRASGKSPNGLLNDNTAHKRVAEFRKHILEREDHVCPVTLIRDKYDPNHKLEPNNPEPRAKLQAAHVLPFSLGNTTGVVWEYIRNFTGDDAVFAIIKDDINTLENGILLEMNAHQAFSDLEWGIETTIEDGVCQYFIKMFSSHLFVHRVGVQTGTELKFSTASGHPLPHPHLCRLHLAVCAVAHACGAAEVLDDLFEHDQDIVGPAAASYTLPADPTPDNFLLPYFERRLFEESALVPTV